MSEKQKPAKPSNEQLQKEYNEFTTVLSQMSEKITQLEGDSEEHRLVLETLTNSDPEKRCYRMIGGVLVEKQVRDVVPVLQNNMEGFKSVLTKLSDDYKKKDKEMKDWVEKYQVKVMQANN